MGPMGRIGKKQMTKYVFSERDIDLMREVATTNWGSATDQQHQSLIALFKETFSPAYLEKITVTDNRPSF